MQYAQNKIVYVYVPFSGSYRERGMHTRSRGYVEAGTNMQTDVSSAMIYDLPYVSKIAKVFPFIYKLPFIQKNPNLR